jgi:glycerophosphoryl diester phosphodiesterase
MNTMSSYLNGTDTYILAHRGGGGGKVPENSLQAFKEAAELGFI